MIGNHNLIDYYIMITIEKYSRSCFVVLNMNQLYFTELNVISIPTYSPNSSIIDINNSWFICSGDEAEHIVELMTSDVKINSLW